MRTVQPYDQLELKGRRGLIAPGITAWGYIRHELLYLGFVLMEVAIVTPLFLVILGWARYWPPYLVALWLALVMLLPLNLVRLMGLLQLSLKQQRRIQILALVLTILFCWRLLLYNVTSPFDLSWLRQFANSLGEGGNLLWTRDLSVFLVTAFTWWRGIRLSIRYPEINNVGLRMRLGGLIIMPLIIWFGTTFTDVNMVPFVLLFFLASLTVISLVRAENIERERSGTASTLNARWFAAVFGAALVIVIASGVIAALVAGDSLFVVMGLLSPLWRALQFGATVATLTLLEIIYPTVEFVARIVQILANLLNDWFGQLSATLRQSNLLRDLGLTDIPTPTESIEVAGPVLGGKALTIFFMLALLILVAFALARTYQKATFAARDSERSRTDRTNADEPGKGRRFLERLGLLRQWRAAASVRRIYRLMCQTAGAAGFPRSASETPYEYLPTLARVWPAFTAETRTITEAFIRVRYGEFPETSEELEVIRSAWRHLEAANPTQREKAAEQGLTLEKRE